MNRPFLTVIVFLLFLTSCSKDRQPEISQPVTVTDIDGNTYQTIHIGNQTWMLENLKTTRLNDGTPLQKFTFGDDWHNGNNPVAYFQWANTDDLNDVHEDQLPFDYYGAMYNHYAIETGKLAPEGWRIPTVEDFKELEAFISRDGYAGMEAAALKSATGWLALSGNGTDAYGFNGLPNGYVHAFGGPTFSEGICTWATTETKAVPKTRVMINLYDQDTILYVENPIQIGAGIRCIKE